MDTLNEGRVWLDTVDTHADEVYRDHRALVDTLVTLPAHMILGLALGALAGAARRMAVNPAEPSSLMEYDAMQLLAEAGESCTTLGTVAAQSAGRRQPARSTNAGPGRISGGDVFV